MPVIPYLSHGTGVSIDPATGLPRKKQQNRSGAQPGPITVPGYTPDYTSIIENALAPLKAQFGAEGVSDTASRNAAIIRGLTQFGQQFNTDTASSAFGKDFVNQAGLSDLLAQANPLAAKNTEAGMSVVARQQKQLEDNIRAIKNALAARGALRSGEAGYQLQQAQNQFDTAQYDARQQLLDYMSAAQQGYQQYERERQRQLVAAEQQAAKDAAAAHPPTSSTTAKPTGQFDVDGEPLYETTDGRIVRIDGSQPRRDSKPPTGGDLGARPPASDSFAAAIAALRAGRDQRLFGGGF